ncbi:MAG: AAA family ATPase, partial [Chloroflexi bacterium]|nr:AAA family ATPase [Chloroflexota bacterium]
VGPAHAAVAELEQEARELAASRRERQQALLAAERELLESENALKASAARVQQLRDQISEEGMTVLPDGRVQAPAPQRRRPEDRDHDEDADDDEEDAMPAARLVLHAPRPAAGGERRERQDDGDQALVGEALPVPIRGGAEVDTAALRTRINELRGEIRALGPVNVDALEDLSDEQERHDYLVDQVADLEAAEGELREAIRELRKLIRARFVETFAVVNERFGEYFARFFGGGHAELTLTDEGDDGEESEPGVDITAQPPGKRVANLSVLSGGERSMTSVALLFALLSVNPAPVVVLDEVDAALDEANVGRFVDTLRELSDRTQFIVVSHNRRTIEAGDALYGVSMADDSSSQVLSLRLADVPAAS